ncbi:hypothetical protein OG594_08730 [Streptomyces sp. NBC_01214]|uniref:hypothetical protein n=1 Tax=Streptomyces sp. NBC_01214 TaxID=2903777 RepID=UPI0022523404|nr:hypothetical protein [Streptomyces sp. NBC_01214]MCX4801734.1 hypothetical protein [Streptomyces sp. NBC_01214]
MNASETVWACIGVATGLLLIATYGWDAWHKGRTRRRWQQSTGNNPQTVAEHRKQREIAQLEAWLRLPLQPRNTIQPQIRRTEDNQ